MKVIRSLVSVVVLAGFLSGCTSLPTIQTQANPGTDYSNYHTFALLPIEAPQTTSDPGLILRIAEPARQAVVAALTDKGLTEVDRDQADLAINLRGQSIPKVQVTDWGYTAPRYARWGYYPAPVRDVDVQTYDEKTLTIEVYDNETKDLAWLGWATTTSERKISVEELQQVIHEILADYPVPSASASSPK